MEKCMFQPKQLTRNRSYRVVSLNKSYSGLHRASAEVCSLKLERKPKVGLEYPYHDVVDLARRE